MMWVSKGSSGGAEDLCKQSVAGAVPDCIQLCCISYPSANILVLRARHLSFPETLAIPTRSGILCYQHICLMHSFVFIPCLFWLLPHPLWKLKQSSVRYLPPSCVGISSFCYKFLFFSLHSSLASWAVQALAATSAEIENVSTLPFPASPLSPWALLYQFSSCFPGICSVGDTLSSLLSLIC